MAVGVRMGTIAGKKTTQTREKVKYGQPESDGLGVIARHDETLGDAEPHRDEHAVGKAQANEGSPRRATAVHEPGHHERDQRDGQIVEPLQKCVVEGGVS